MKIVDSYRNIHHFCSIHRADAPDGSVRGGWPFQGDGVRYKEWNSRQSTVIKDEMLEWLDCEDTWFEEG